MPDTSGIVRSHKMTSNPAPLVRSSMACLPSTSTVTSCGSPSSRLIVRPTAGSSSTTSTRAARAGEERTTALERAWLSSPLAPSPVVAWRVVCSANSSLTLGASIYIAGAKRVSSHVSLREIEAQSRWSRRTFTHLARLVSRALEKRREHRGRVRRNAPIRHRALDGKRRRGSCAERATYANESGNIDESRARARRRRSPLASPALRCAERYLRAPHGTRAIAPPR